MAIDGGFLQCLARELKEQLIDVRVEKVFEPSLDEIVLSLRAPRFSKKLIISARQTAPRIHFTEFPPENPPQAPMFCMLLRKYLGGAKIKDIKTFSLERVLEIVFESRNEMGDTIYPSLIVELITAAPNIIFVDNDRNIVDSVRRTNLEKNVRIIAPGAKYTLPASLGKINPLEHTVEEIVTEIKKQPDCPLEKVFLNLIDGVSPLISRELAFLLEGNNGSRVADTTTKKLNRVIELLKTSLLSGAPYLISNPKGEAHDISYMPIMQYGSGYGRLQYKSFSELLDEYFNKYKQKDNIRRSSDDLLKILGNLISRTQKKINAREGDLKKCERRETYRIYGELIKANIYNIKKGAESVSVLNYYEEVPTEIEIPLNPAKSPGDNATAYFNTYKKYCVATKTLEGLINEAKDELKYLESVFDNLSRATCTSDLNLIREELRETGYIKSQNTPKKRKAPAFNFYEYVSSEGFSILAGRTGIQNDELTCKRAQKTDLWFHTKDIPGSHIILELEGKQPTDLAILEAAEIAAYHSRACNSSKVEVDYTPIKYVKKPNGARPGMVIYTTNQTIIVTPKKEKTLELLKDKNK